MNRRVHKREKEKETAKAERRPITRFKLEQAIADDIKGTTDCEQFVGVIIERVTPETADGTNWALKGVKYGKADRTICDAALSACLAQQALQFNLADESERADAP